MSTRFNEVNTPEVLYVETAAVDIPTPAAGHQETFIDSTTHRMSRKNSADVVVDLEAIGQMLSADPAAPVNGQFWITDDGGTPASIALKFRKGGVTYTLAEVTV